MTWYCSRSHWSTTCTHAPHHDLATGVNPFYKRLRHIIIDILWTLCVTHYVYVCYQSRANATPDPALEVTAINPRSAHLVTKGNSSRNRPSCLRQAKPIISPLSNSQIVWTPVSEHLRSIVTAVMKHYNWLKVIVCGYNGSHNTHQTSIYCFKLTLDICVCCRLVRSFIWSFTVDGY